MQIIYPTPVDAINDDIYVKKGMFLPLSSTSSMPLVLPLKKHKQYRFFSLVMFDPDAVGGNKIHWMVVNMKNHLYNNKSKKDDNLSIKNLSPTVMFSYVRPSPPKGSGTHRYIFWWLGHPCPLNERNIQSFQNVPTKKRRFISIPSLLERFPVSTEVLETNYFLSSRDL
jgi:hypothetical protein